MFAQVVNTQVIKTNDIATCIAKSSLFSVATEFVCKVSFTYNKIINHSNWHILTICGRTGLKKNGKTHL